MRTFKIILGLAILVASLALLGISIQQTIVTSNWNWLWIGLFGIVLGFAGYEITAGGSVKDTLKEIFSWLMWWS